MLLRTEGASQIQIQIQLQIQIHTNTYVLPVTEGAGQHAARVEPYAGLQRTKKSNFYKSKETWLG